ncbi:6-hydroxymethyl-7,8-dihydropterin pyrophosphokinase [Candidatus Methanobinarius endosymbioticus]|uniref:6-hydroxymethyl-7,8-dihydropterin pyrophosphokinase n=1 Tax=Candidatus Methanobinarius endosymbioticus TaxID=2006182 RepID=A0A366MD86_9EURY|nr:6-hydroxymethyl-7,8-dihydropterin pyrophosphokinase [Candidatus Methanobinarius endosymbioticus]
MNFEEWDKWYEEILKDFGFSREDDERTASVLNKLLGNYGSIDIEDLVNNLHHENAAIHNFKRDKSTIKSFMVFGAGPSLKKDINYIKSRCNIEDPEDYIIIAADGATTGLLEEKIVPDIIVTDLDGKIEDLMLANDLRSFFVLHAHGNNFDQILKYTEKIHKVLGTTQSKPFSNLYNFGGFTDGDRAVFLAVALNAKKIVLAGMDFGKIVSKYSRPDIKDEAALADETKQKKLQYAEKLIDWVKENKNIEIINLSKQ